MTPSRESSMSAAVQHMAVGVAVMILGAILLNVSHQLSLVWWIGVGLWLGALFNWVWAVVLWTKAARR